MTLRFPNRAIFSLLLLGFAAPLFATTRIWSGASNGLWSNAANWTNGAPIAGDSLNFGAGQGNMATTNDFPANTEFAHLTFGDSYTVSGNSLSLSGGVSVTAGAPAFSVPVTLTASQTWTIDSTGPLGASVDVNGTTWTINSNGPASSFSFEADLSATIKGSGNVVVNGQGNTNLHASSTTAMITNHGVLILTGLTNGPVVNYGYLWPRAAGTMAGGLTNFGILAPEEAATSSLSLQPGSTYEPHLGESRPNTILFADTIALGGAALDVHSAFQGAGSTYTVIFNTGSSPVQGTFASLPEGSIVQSTTLPQRFRVSYVGANGRSVTLTSVGATPSVNITRSPLFPRVGQPITFTVTVSGGSGVPTGNVSFSLDDFQGTGTLNSSGSTSVTLPSLAADSGYRFLAVYQGDATYTGGVKVSVFDVLPSTPIPALNHFVLATLMIALAAAALSRSR
jgi:uncharacterized repeat protein (TIGR01451 family)